MVFQDKAVQFEKHIQLKKKELSDSDFMTNNKSIILDENNIILWSVFDIKGKT